jgi:hypothetical protein
MNWRAISELSLQKNGGIVTVEEENLSDLGLVSEEFYRIP